MKRLGFICGLLAAPFLTHTVSGEALPPIPVTAAMIAQEKTLAQQLAAANTAFLVTPRLTDNLAASFATLAKRNISVTVITVRSGISQKAVMTLKKSGARVGFAPRTFNESALAATGFIATGGILQGKRGANIINDKLVADEMIGTFKDLGKRVSWQ